MLDNVKKNLVKWDEQYTWPQHGDEWYGQAALCGVPYDVWKQSMVQHLIVPNVTEPSHVLEIACGHGRWTEFLVKYAGHVTAVDLSASCLNYCRNRFRDQGNIDYFLTTGNTLPRCASGLIDFVWSYDSFVHMDREVICRYLSEIRRVLKVGGSAILHHANVDDLANHQQDGAPGWRSAMNIALMAQLAREARLSVVSQFAYWDIEKQIGAPRFGDRITHLRRESDAI